MGYNKFKWWRNGARKEPLSFNAHLYDKIVNGDFDISDFFKQALAARKKANRAYELAYKKYFFNSHFICHSGVFCEKSRTKQCK